MKVRIQTIPGGNGMLEGKSRLVNSQEAHPLRFLLPSPCKSCPPGAIIGEGKAKPWAIYRSNSVICGGGLPG